MRIFGKNYSLCIALVCILHLACHVLLSAYTGQSEGGRERGVTGPRRQRERESHLISPGETLDTISASDQTTNKTTKKIILNNLLIKSVSLFWPRGRVGWQRGMISLGGSRSSEVPALCGM